MAEVAVASAAAAGLGAHLAASAAPLVLESPRTKSPFQGGGEPLVITGNRLYVLLDEAANTPKIVLRADVDSAGQAGQGTASEPVISADGSVVCYESSANLLQGSPGKRGAIKIYCHDFDLGSTDLVSGVQSSPSQGSLCGGGRGPSDKASLAPAVSADGNRVCFESDGVKLLGTNRDRNDVRDVFVNDRRTCETVRVSVKASGAESVQPSSQCDIAADGTLVAFVSDGPLVTADGDQAPDVYLRTLSGGSDPRTDPFRLGAPLLVSAGLPGRAGRPSLARNGTRIAFEQTVGSATTVVVRDVDLATAVVTGSGGLRFQGRKPSISEDGRLLTLESQNPVSGQFEVSVVDLALSAARGTAVSYPAALTSTLEDIHAESSDADVCSTAVAFTSPVALTPGDARAADDPDVYIRDHLTRLVQRVDGGTASALGGGRPSRTRARQSPASLRARPRRWRRSRRQRILARLGPRGPRPRHSAARPRGRRRGAAGRGRRRHRGAPRARRDRGGSHLRRTIVRGRDAHRRRPAVGSRQGSRRLGGGGLCAPRGERARGVRGGCGRRAQRPRDGGRVARRRRTLRGLHDGRRACTSRGFRAHRGSLRSRLHGRARHPPLHRERQRLRRVRPLRARRQRRSQRRRDRRRVRPRRGRARQRTLGRDGIDGAPVHPRGLRSPLPVARLSERPRRFGPGPVPHARVSGGRQLRDLWRGLPTGGPKVRPRSGRLSATSS